jgi:S-adenosylmethionine-diacylglycerol 3-amino-3-carboxypropyl transferase
MNTARVVQHNVSNQVFNWVHKNNLIYNTCWEDPAIDRVALDLRPTDRLLVISSAGCNALDYLLAGCGEVHAIDVNPIQNALLELKISAIRNLEFRDFNLFFGEGHHPRAESVYERKLRHSLGEMSRFFWDKNIAYFAGHGWRDSFYYRGCSGFLAKFLIAHLFHVKSLRKPLEDLVNSDSLAQQREVYESEIKPRVWTAWMQWLLSRNMTMNLMGVPPSQKHYLANEFPGGVSKYIEASLETVLTKLPFKENYFYRVYIEGRYPEECRPEYIKEANYGRLQRRMNDIFVHTGSVANFLEGSNLTFSRFVLLDHMDWLSSHLKGELVREWSAIMRRSELGARIIFRSASRRVTYLDDISVPVNGAPEKLLSMLRFDEFLAARLHTLDRVHTYASFYIADRV